MSVEASPPDAARIPWRRVLVGWLVLHALCSVRYPWEPAEAWPALLRPSPDFFALLGLAYLLARRGSLPRALHAVLLALFLWLPIYRCGRSVVEVFHGKELDLYNDVLLLPGLWHLLLHEHAPPVQVALVAGAVAGGVAIAWLVGRCLRWALLGAGRRGARFGFLGAAALVLGLALVAEGSDEIEDGGPCSEPLLVESGIHVARVWDRWQEARTFAGLLEAAERKVAALPQDLAGLGGADVFLLFLESYGRALFRSPECLAEFETWASTWEAELAADGVAVVSGAAYPSVRGGASSLTHAELLCGVQVPNYRVFDTLLKSSLDALPRILTRAGYRSVNAQPATYQDWPEGAFFGFGEDYFLDRFPYDGRAYPWGTMPDQFALHHLIEEVIRPSERPLFLQYVSVTCHAPFNAVPPLFEDWDALDNVDWDLDPVVSLPIDWGNYRGHPRVEEGYLALVHYSLEVMLAFVRRLPRPALVIVIGDHQAPGLAGLERFDLSHDVPVHVLSQRPELLAPFEAAGFAPGMVPPAGYEAFSTSLFLENFLRAYSAGQPSPDADG